MYCRSIILFMKTEGSEMPGFGIFTTVKHAYSWDIPFNFLSLLKYCIIFMLCAYWLVSYTKVALDFVATYVFTALEEVSSDYSVLGDKNHCRLLRYGMQ
jgi:hypothetical protein